VPLQKLIVRQVLVGALIGVLIALSRGISTGIIYGLLFVAISTPLAYWVEQRKARLQDEQADAPDER
jgi:hypothetical protein